MVNKRYTNNTTDLILQIHRCYKSTKGYKVCYSLWDKKGHMYEYGKNTILKEHFFHINYECDNRGNKL